MITAELKIEKYSKKGHGLAQHTQGNKEPQVIEVAHTVKGDVILAQLMRKNKRKKKGKLLEIVEPASSRVIPRCSHARICGGCTWQQVAYEEQCKVKQAHIEALFAPWIDSSQTVRPIIGQKDPWHYRNKMEFSFSENRAGTQFLGLMIAQGASYVFNVEKCHIAPNWFSEALQAVRAWWQDTKVPAFQFHLNTGVLRNLTIREGARTHDKLVMLTIQGSPNDTMTQSTLQSFIQAVQGSVSGEVSIFLRMQQTAKGMRTQFYDFHLAGPNFMQEKLQLSIGNRNIELSCKISPTSFFQPNTRQAEKLYEEAFSLLGGREEELVFDLYSGTGTLSMIAAQFAKQVIGIELHPESVFDAEENLKNNHIENVKFIQGDVGKTITELMNRPDFESPSLVIVDPPRAGLDALALDDLDRLSAKRILYISCNPQTQVSNIQELFEMGYRLEAIQPVDQFPHTAHIENIVLLKKS